MKKKLLAKIEQEIFNQTSLKVPFTLEEKNGYGDFVSNIFLSNKIAKNKIEEIKQIIQKQDFVQDVKIQNNFLNLYVKKTFWQQNLKKILVDGFQDLKVLSPQKISIEILSTNPTGNIHCGNARIGIYADVIANVKSILGHEISREYYVNDCGEQINKLGESVYQYFLKAQGKKYCKEKIIYNDVEQIISKITSANSPKEIQKIAVEENMQKIKQDIKTMDLKIDKFFFESSFNPEKIIQELKKQNLVYKACSKLTKQECLFFKSTNFGDTEDRVIQKSNGKFTYFAYDLVYHLEKANRSDKIINVWGCDHKSYVERLANALKAIRKVDIDFVLCQIVNIFENNEKKKISKREGTAVNISEIIKKVGLDSIRFDLASKNFDKHHTINIQNLKEISYENKIFYIQYAYSRTCSLLKGSDLKVEDTNFNLLNDNEEIEIIKKISYLEEVILKVDQTYNISYIPDFAFKLSKLFHARWNQGKYDRRKIFLSEKKDITLARLGMVQGIQFALKTALKLLGINPKERM